MAHTVVMDRWPLGDDRHVELALIEYEGRWRVDARIWLRAEDGTIHPGRGLSLPIRHMERLVAAMQKTHRGAVARDLIPPSPAKDDQ